MSCAQDNGSKKYFCPFSAGMEFTMAMDEAKAMVEAGDERSALRLLQRLERRYVDASEMFLLLGEVLERIGKTEEGAGYKTFYEVLRGAFRSALGDVSRPDTRDPYGLPESRTADPITSMSRVEERAMDLEETAKRRKTPDQDWRPEREADPIMDWRENLRSSPMERESGPQRSDYKDSLYPVTAAMGMEFLRQGHFGRAVEIFDMLVERNPDDKVLREARERARRKMKEKKVLDTLQGWLGNAKFKKAQEPEK